MKPALSFRILSGCTLMLLAAQVLAQSAPRIEPYASVTETFTSNAGLSRNNAQADQITEVSVGLRASSGGGRITGFFDYSLSGQAYAQGTASDSHRQALNASGTVVAVENRVFVDLSGIISQQAVSAFGTQSVGNVQANSNLSETTTLRMSPYVRGELGSNANYQVRYSLASTRSADASASNSVAKDLTATVAGGTAFKRLSWSVDASRQQVDFANGRDTENDRFRTSLIAALTPQLSVAAIASVESSNFSTASKESQRLGGWGVNWSPSEVTKLSLLRENRPFGSSHNLSFEHRSGRTVWRLSDSKDVSVGSSQLSGPSLGSVYDLFYAQFAAVESDPIKRAQLVSQFLQANGINPNDIAQPAAYLTSSVSVQRRQSLSVALLGVRDTVTVLLSRSEGNRIDTVSGAVDDFSNTPVVRQTGVSVNVAHRLTPDTSLNVTLSGQKSSGINSQQETSLYSMLAGLSTKVGMRSTATLGLRRVVFQNDTAPYDESAVTVNFGMRF